MVRNNFLILLTIGSLAMSACLAENENDKCKASEYQDYIGKPLAEFTALKPEEIFKSHRIIYRNSMVTADYLENRINIYVGSNADDLTSEKIIERIVCG